MSRNSKYNRPQKFNDGEKDFEPISDPIVDEEETPVAYFNHEPVVEVEEVVQVEEVISSSDLTDYATVVGCKNLNVRKGPSRKEAVVRIVPSGTVLHVSAMQDIWAVVDGDGFTGYAMCKYLEQA